MTRLFFAAALLAAGPALAQMTPVGTLAHIDDSKTGQARAEIAIDATVRALSNGRVEKQPSSDVQPRPVAICAPTTARASPSIGLEIIRGAKKAGKEPVWEGGTILDPENGKLYKLRLTPHRRRQSSRCAALSDPSFRTQTWVRVP
jgi:uncharacterized protein (DUF2147 family)